MLCSSNMCALCARLPHSTLLLTPRVFSFSPPSLEIVRPKMSLSKMPPEVLSCILNNGAMPLRHRLHLRLLSTLWCEIIQDGLKKVTSLVIRDAANVFSPTETPNDLIIDSSLHYLKNEHIGLLVRLFPGITQLSFAFGSNGKPSISWSNVPFLLANWSTKLVTLQMYDKGGHPYPKAALIRHIKALSTLTCLTLYDHELTCCLLPHLGPVLGRLEKFACPFSCARFASFLSASLSSRCTHLRLSHSTFDCFSGAFLRQLSTSLKCLHLDRFPNTHRSDWLSLSQMHQLMSLSLDFSGITQFDSYLLGHLCPLTRMTDLALYHLFYSTRLVLLSEEAPLSSIKRLTLQVERFDVSSLDYGDFFGFISCKFPGLSSLTLFCHSQIHSHIQASLGQVSFSVDIHPYFSYNFLSTSW